MTDTEEILKISRGFPAEPYSNTELFNAMAAYLIGGTTIIHGKKIRGVKSRKTNLKRAAALLIHEINRIDEAEE
ncbi:hypothetical protein [Dialister invisus]|jgi:hypothetical protein|uniref:hypothetical protein n=1 Tax=Dialister invisus TaxID=218538 RepID=UPI0020513C9C|nr:hypothetical protein [Dialister invisus]DAK11850.1 MAG TPA: hypothetical protein [Caudoviricetes sp.]